ncbi:phosphate signaling complex protein PhoU [Risungbinella massiliensis]|uniref:phosphate signaling complex protein PhoU n=1 Tax=Risungbinella massiliensis TaxID=1329796 RepID=UPI0005CC4C65|nr:phosphate signaling complex protein PhoU [Risungbinella massiliensis]
MVRPFDTSLQEIKRLLLQMARMVEISIHQGVQSLQTGNVDLAKKVIQEDIQINEMEDLIDDKVMILIATQQPVARDLRLLIAAIRLANDLERMADLAEDIAEITLELHENNLVIQPQIPEIDKMAEQTQAMVHDGINSYVDGNIMLAKSLAVADDKVDDLYEKVFREMMQRMKDDNQKEVALKICFVARFLERIADHTVNLGESVVFIETGKQRDLN